MRVAIGQLWQETNTLNPIPTTRANFEDFGVTRGDHLVQQMSTTNELGGFIQSMKKWPTCPEIVGLVRLPAWPSGTVTQDAFQWIIEQFTDAMKAALPVDAVLLALHGAMVAEGAPDVEGEVLAAVRSVIGKKIPLVATLDLHAEVTPKMVSHADALVLYHTAPHIDVFETGERGAAVMRKILFEGARPVMAFARIPMVTPAERANTENPVSVSHGLKQRLQSLEADPGVLAAGLAVVQPWLDIPDLGSSVVIVTNNDRPLATKTCQELARELWMKRFEYLPELVSVAEGVHEAHETKTGLCVLSDSADATTSGAAGDSTWVLRELLKYDWPRPALLTFVAPEVVNKAASMKIGATAEFTIGGVRDHRFSQPVTLTAEVVRLFDAKFTLNGHIARNLPIDMGRSAVLKSGNIHLIVTPTSGPHFAPQLFESAGLKPFEAQVLIAKSPCGFRAAYEARAAKVLVVRAPGCAPSDFWNYEFPHITRPLWPWDDIEEYDPEVILHEPSSS